MTTAVGVMARAPSSAGKSRLAPHLPPARLTALRRALLADTLAALAEVPQLFVFVTPDEAAGELETAAPVVPQGDGDLGVRMQRAVELLLQASRDAAILVGSDIPLLTADHIREAAGALEAGSATASAERRVVLGPADDGGYYLIGMTRLHPELFDRIEWGTASVLTDTLRAAERAGIEAHLARSTYDVDTIDDLLRLERDLAWAPSSVAPALRRWFSEE